MSDLQLLKDSLFAVDTPSYEDAATAMPDSSVWKLQGALHQSRWDEQSQSESSAFEPLQSIPGFGTTIEFGRGMGLREAVGRIGEGHGTDSDYDVYADWIADEERKARASGTTKAFYGMLDSLGLGAEILATGGVAGGVRGAVGTGVKKFTKEALKQSAKTLAKRGGELTARTAAATALTGDPFVRATEYATPELGVGRGDDGQLEVVIAQEGDDMPEALAKGLARSMVMRGVETFGGEAIGALGGAALNRLPGVQNAKAQLAKYWMGSKGKTVSDLSQSLARRAGWSNLLGEIGEERADEIIAGALGLEDDFGLTGRLATMAGGAVGLASEDDAAQAQKGFISDAGVELMTVLATGAAIQGAAVAGVEIADVIDQIRQGKPLSRKQAKSMGLKVGSKGERKKAVDELWLTASEKAHQLLNDNPEAALAWMNQDEVSPTEYEAAAGEAPPFESFGMLVKDALNSIRRENPEAVLELAKAVYRGRIEQREAAERASAEQSEAAVAAKVPELRERGLSYDGLMDIALNDMDSTTRQAAMRLAREKSPADSRETGERKTDVLPDDDVIDPITELDKLTPDEQLKEIRASYRQKSGEVRGTSALGPDTIDKQGRWKPKTPQAIKERYQQLLFATEMAAGKEPLTLEEMEGDVAARAAEEREKLKKEGAKGSQEPLRKGIARSRKGVRKQSEPDHIPDPGKKVEPVTTSPEPVEETEESRQVEPATGKESLQVQSPAVVKESLTTQPPPEPVEPPKPKRDVRKKSTEEIPQLSEPSPAPEKQTKTVELTKSGDYYNVTGEHARDVASILGLTVTGGSASKHSDLPESAGFLYYNLEESVAALEKAGYQVAVNEPAPEKPKPVRNPRRSVRKPKNPYAATPLKKLNDIAEARGLPRRKNKEQAAQEVLEAGVLRRGESMSFDEQRALVRKLGTKTEGRQTKKKVRDIVDTFHKTVEYKAVKAKVSPAAVLDRANELYERDHQVWQDFMDVQGKAHKEIRQAVNFNLLDPAGDETQIEDFDTYVSEYSSVIRGSGSVSPSDEFGVAETTLSDLWEFIKEPLPPEPTLDEYVDDAAESVAGDREAQRQEMAEGEFTLFSPAARRPPKIERDIMAALEDIGGAEARDVPVTDVRERVKGTDKRFNDALLALDQSGEVVWNPGRGTLATPAGVRAKTAPKSDMTPRLVAAMRKVSPGADGGAAVSLRDVRQLFPELSKGAFDDAVLVAAKSGAISLHRHDLPAGMNDAERANLVRDGETYYVAANIRQNTGGGVMESPTMELRGQKRAERQQRARKNAERDRTRQQRESREQRAALSPDQPPPKSVHGSTGTGGRASAGHEVLESMFDVADALGFTMSMHIGRLQNKNAAGVWKPFQAIARIKQMMDVPAAVHETGHAIATMTVPHTSPAGVRTRKPGPGRFGKGYEPIGLNRAARKELEELGHQLYGDQIPKGGYVNEGVAELVKFYVLDPSRLEAYPAAAQWFEKQVLSQHKRVDKAFRKAQAKGTSWYGATSADRGRSLMVDTGVNTRIREFRRYWQERPFLDSIVESGLVLRDIQNEAERNLGRELTGRERVYDQFKARRLTGSAVAKEMTERGMVDSLGRVVGPSLKDVIKDAGVTNKELPDFLLYLLARRTHASLTDTRGPRHTGMSLEDANQIIQDFENGRFVEAAEGWYKWHDQLLDYVGELSPTLKAGTVLMREFDPGDYVPIHRVFEYWEDRKTAGLKGGGGSVAAGRLGGQRKGDSRRLVNILETSIAKAEERVSLAHQRANLDSVLTLARIAPGLGRYVNKVERENLPEAQRTIHDILSQVVAKMGDPGGQVDLSKATLTIQVDGKPVELDLQGVLEEWVTLWGPARMPSGGDSVVPVVENGQLNWYAIQPRVLNALVGGEESRIANPAARVAFKFVRGTNLPLKMGTTVLYPGFSFITAPLRDVWEYTTRSSATPQEGDMVRAVYEMTKFILSEGMSVLSGRTYQSKVSKLFDQLGLERAQRYTHLKPATSRKAKGMFKVVTPGKVFDWYVDSLQFTDRAARLAEMNIVMKRHGMDPDNLNTDEALTLILAAKEATTDFGSGGHLSWIANGISPWFGAMVSGARRGASVTYHHPVRTLARQLVKAGAVMALWWSYKDEEWWEEMPAYEKWNYVHIPVGDERIRLPMPQDTENLVVMGLLSAADSLYRQDPEAAWEWFRNFRELSTPMLPVLAQELWEQGNNADSFSEIPIVTQGMPQLYEEGQFNEYTSETAKWLGDNLGMSPARIDHAIKNTTGSIGRFALGLMDWTVESATDEGREKGLSEYPLAGRLMGRGGLMTSRPESVDDAYDMWMKAEERFEASKVSGNPPETPQARQMRLMLKDGTRALSAYSGIRKELDSVDDRRAVTRQMSELAQRLREDVARERVNRGYYQARRKRAEAREKAVEARAN